MFTFTDPGVHVPAIFAFTIERNTQLLEEINARRMQRYDASRRQPFERIDKPALMALPSEAFTYADWKTARLNIDYHVEVDHHLYSAPYKLVHEQLDVRLSASTVELFYKNQRVASHPRSFARGRHTTDAAHMPKAHQKHSDWSPSRIIDWASTIGPSTSALAEAILTERTHPEQGYRSRLGILRLAKCYGNDRLEAACARALAVRARSYRHVESILKNGLDRLPTPALASAAAPAAFPQLHENIRGGDYYQ